MLKFNHEILYNPWTIKSDFFFFFFQTESIWFHNISACKSPKMISPKWCTSTKVMILKMYGSLAEDHATLGGAADGWKNKTSATFTFIAVYMPFWCSVHTGEVFLSSPFHSSLCSSGPDRHVPKTKVTPLTVLWLSSSETSSPSVCHHSSNQSILLFFHQHCISFCVVLMCFTVLFLCIVGPQ